MIPRSLIHVGYHRTGSTWLQTVLFTKGNGFVSPWDRGTIKSQLVAVHPFRFDPGLARERFARELAASDGQWIPVVSHERLSGNPHFGGEDRRELADRLAAVFPGGRVLVVIREQTDMILSCWRHYVNLGGPNSLTNYMIAAWTVLGRIPRFDFRHFEYDALIRYYQQQFGRDAVLVLPFEMLKRDTRGFVSAIAGFAGTGAPSRLDTRPRNVSLSGPACALRRRMNLFLVRSSVNPSALAYIPGMRVALGRGLQAVDALVPRRLDEAWHRRARALIRRTAGNRYVESNRTTMELTGIDLRAYGYAC